MLEFILDATYAVLRHGWSLTALVGVLILFFKNRKMKRYINHYLPRILRSNGDIDLHEIKQNIEIIMLHLGVEPCADSLKPTTPFSVKIKRMPSISRWLVYIIARSVRRNTNLNMMRRKKKMLQKFKSRKFILAVVSAALIIANDGLDLGIDSDTVLAFAGIVAVWITGESVVDATRTGKEQDDGIHYR